MLVRGSLLAQQRPAGTSAVEGFAATLRTEITQIAICNTTASPVTFSIYHDDQGSSTFDQTTALQYDSTIPANSTIYLMSESMSAGWTLSRDGQIGIKTGTGNALNFSIYGVTEDISRT